MWYKNTTNYLYFSAKYKGQHAKWNKSDKDQHLMTQSKWKIRLNKWTYRKKTKNYKLYNKTVMIRK